ncbi:MAG: rhodanese-like domain-containing protein [Chitinophagaceae bacterium]
MRYILLAFVLCCSLSGFSQYKNDNTLFKTVFVEDLCSQLKKTPGALLLDVRSKGEYEDTSTFYSLNIGRLTNTTHLDITEMPARWRELTAYKDKPVYVMCSHSQRSRRVSKMLTDSGFTNIINVNGGLTTYNLLPAAAVCKDQLYQTANSFKFISPLDLCSFLNANKDAFILDVRSDSTYKGIATNERQNAAGNIKGSVSIPFASLESSLSQIPSGKKILVVDDFGNDAPRAALLLLKKGHTDVQVLFNGMDMLMSRSRNEVNCMDKFLTRTASYQLISSDEFDALVRKEQNLTIVDVRPADEFSNQSKTGWRNIGRIRNAVNIPDSVFASRINELDKNKKIVIYYFSNGTDAFRSAKRLTDQGFKNVYVLTGGIFNLRWQAANYKGRSQLKEHVVDIPAENL